MSIDFEIPEIIIDYEEKIINESQDARKSIRRVG